MLHHEKIFEFQILIIYIFSMNEGNKYQTALILQVQIFWNILKLMIINELIISSILRFKIIAGMFYGFIAIFFSNATSKLIGESPGD